MLSKLEKESKREWIENYTNWSISNYGIPIIINPEVIPVFKDGIALDVENYEDGRFLLVGIFDGTTYYGWTNLEELKKVSIPRFTGHNGVSDLMKLREWGFKLVDTHLIWDTQLIEHFIDSSLQGYALTKVAERRLNIKYPSYEDICGSKKSNNRTPLSLFPIRLAIEKNAQDCYCTYQITQKQQRELLNLDYYEKIEQPCAFVFKSMEERGIRIDLEYLKELKEYLEEQKQPIEREIKNELGDINLNSPKQLLEALHTKEIYPEFKGKASTDKRALIRMVGNEVVSQLLSYSEIDTLLSSFVYPYIERNQEIAHPFFNQCGTRTGRLSCSNPNLLQIPKRTENGKLVRRMFIARESYLFGDCDYGQIEPRILAHLSKDRTLCEMFNGNVDFHEFTSDRLRIHREKAKILNLSVGYRATFKSVSQQLKCTDKEAQIEIDNWWAMFPGLREWQDKLIWTSKKNGYFTTLMGRKIKVEGLNEYNRWKRDAAQRQLINNIAQASAAEVMKTGMIRVSNRAYCYPLVQVYDELLFEYDKLYPEIVQEVKFDMERAYTLDVPLVCEAKIGKNWSEMDTV